MLPFEPERLPIFVEWEPLIPLIGKANRALAQYDGVLYGLPNPEVLLSPMTTQEAVLSSRIEGTQATLGEVLKFEAGDQPQQESKRLDISGNHQLPGCTKERGSSPGGAPLQSQSSSRTSFIESDSSRLTE